MCYRFLLLLLLPTFAWAQAGKGPAVPYFNTDSVWHNLIQDEASSMQACVEEPAIIVVSNRQPAPGDLRFMSQLRDPDSLRYFIIYLREGQWHVLRVSGLRVAVHLLRCDTARHERDWVIYTEGMGKVFPANLNRAFSMSAQYGVHVVMLDYPSIRSDLSSFRNFTTARANARKAGADFMPLLDTLQRLKTTGVLGEGRLSLFYHSLGNQAIRALMRSGRIGKMNTEVWADNLVLNAACVPRRGAARWLNKIAFAKRVFVLYNPHDATLRWARLASFHGILGERPTRPLSKRATYINFHMVSGEGHSNFLSLPGRKPAMPEAVDFYRVLLHGEQPNRKEFTNLKKSRYKGIGEDLWPLL